MQYAAADRLQTACVESSMTVMNVGNNSPYTHIMRHTIDFVQLYLQIETAFKLAIFYCAFPVVIRANYRRFGPFQLQCSRGVPFGKNSVVAVDMVVFEAYFKYQREI
jgi:hypothetical protein